MKEVNNQKNKAVQEALASFLMDGLYVSASTIIKARQNSKENQSVLKLVKEKRFYGLSKNN